MKKITVLSVIGLFLFVSACGTDKTNENGSTENEGAKTESAQTAETSTENPSYDPHRGEGKYTDVKVDEKLNVKMANEGENVFNVKCSSCHKLTDEKLVGPGWAGVTQRRQLTWIMNFITNPDVMLDKDPEAQAMLELCLVRMPNQNLSDDEAINLLEFMRKNDGVQP
jgi:mono/diheme cytochrome c family protein